jgi:hypothetical protein
MKKRTRKKRISLRKIKKLKIALIGIIVFAIILTALLSINSRPVETTEESKIKISPEKISLKIISPENRTYTTNNVVLAVTSSESAKWISNSFDSQPNATECDGCSSYGRYDLKFENGVHTISVYASDKEDRITMATVTFTVKT